MYQWNLSAQFHLSQTLSFDIGYVGSEGKNLLIARGLNQPLLASPGNPVNGITTNTAENANLRVPILGETPTALTDNEFTGGSWYHSLQATLRKQASRGLAFQATYTYSRAASNTTIYNDPGNLSLDWARASFDRTHRFTANFDYQLPGRMKGWTAAGIIIVQSRLPMTLTDPNAGGVYAHAAPATVTLCPGASYSSLVTAGDTGSRLTHWIDTPAPCTPPALGSDGCTPSPRAGPS